MYWLCFTGDIIYVQDVWIMVYLFLNNREGWRWHWVSGVIVGEFLVQVTNVKEKYVLWDTDISLPVMALDDHHSGLQHFFVKSSQIYFDWVCSLPARVPTPYFGE